MITLIYKYELTDNGGSLFCGGCGLYQIEKYISRWYSSKIKMSRIQNVKILNWIRQSFNADKTERIRQFKFLKLRNLFHLKPIIKIIKE